MGLQSFATDETSDLVRVLGPGAAIGLAGCAGVGAPSSDDGGDDDSPSTFEWGFTLGVAKPE